MRESFVFHAEYINDLPDCYKANFTNYTVRYGLYGEVPPIEPETLEHSLWVKIQRRIDAEAEKYRTVSEKRRKAAQQRNAQRYSGAERKPEAQEEKPAETETAENGQAEPEKEPGAPKRTRFAKPTAAEIAAYCAEQRNGIDAQAFFDFYESKGWKIGSQHMKDWRACVRTWEQRRKGESTGGRTRQPGGIWGNENEVPEEIMDAF